MSSDLCTKGDSAGESGGGDGDDDGGDGTGYSIDDLVAEDADDAGGSYNSRGGGVAALSRERQGPGGAAHSSQ